MVIGINRDCSPAVSGGPDGELGASLRYLSQRYSMPFPELKGLLTDIGVEESNPRNCPYQKPGSRETCCRVTSLEMDHSVSAIFLAT